MPKNSIAVFLEHFSKNITSVKSSGKIYRKAIKYQKKKRKMSGRYYFMWIDFAVDLISQIRVTKRHTWIIFCN